jgi:hypothetical protein
MHLEAPCPHGASNARGSARSTCTSRHPQPHRVLRAGGRLPPNEVSKSRFCPHWRFKLVPCCSFQTVTTRASNSQECTWRRRALTALGVKLVPCCAFQTVTERASNSQECASRRRALTAQVTRAGARIPPALPCIRSQKGSLWLAGSPSPLRLQTKPLDPSRHWLCGTQQTRSRVKTRLRVVLASAQTAHDERTPRVHRGYPPLQHDPHA